MLCLSPICSRGICSLPTVKVPTPPTPPTPPVPPVEGGGGPMGPRKRKPKWLIDLEEAEARRRLANAEKDWRIRRDDEEIAIIL